MGEKEPQATNTSGVLLSSILKKQLFMLSELYIQYKSFYPYYHSSPSAAQPPFSFLVLTRMFF